MFAGSSSALALTAVATAAVTSSAPPPLSPLPSLPILPASVEYGKAVKQYPCLTCGKSFPRQSNLTRHIANLHTNSSKEECGMCGQHFKPGRLLQHQKECTGVSELTAATLLAAPTADAAPLVVDTPSPSPVDLPSPPSPPVESTADSLTPRSPLANDTIDAAGDDYFEWLTKPAMEREQMMG